MDFRSVSKQFDKVVLDLRDHRNAMKDQAEKDDSGNDSIDDEDGERNGIFDLANISDSLKLKANLFYTNVFKPAVSDSKIGKK